MLVLLSVAEAKRGNFADAKFAVRAEDVVGVCLHPSGEYTSVYVGGHALENLYYAEETPEEVARKVNDAIANSRIYYIPPTPSFPSVIPLNTPAVPTDCGCPPYAYCGNVACPRRTVVTYGNTSPPPDRTVPMG